MSVTVYLIVEDIADKIATYSKIELESSTSPGSGFSEVTEITLVAGTEYYSYEDTGGTVSTYYRYRFSSADDLTKSSYSNVFLPAGLTRKLLRQDVLKAYRVGRVFSASGGDTTSVITNDPFIKFSEFNANRGQNHILLCTSGDNDGEWRRVSASDLPNGDYTVNPAYSNAVASGVVVEQHWLTDPDTFNELINRALKRYWYIDRVPIDPVADTKVYSLASIGWLRRENQLTGLWYVPDSSTTIRQPWAQGGQWWNYSTDQFGIEIQVEPAPSTSATLYLEAFHQGEPLYNDDDQLPAGMDMELAAALVYDELMAHMLRPGQVGNAIDTLAWRQARQEHQSELRQLFRRDRNKIRFALPIFPQPPVVPQPYQARSS